MKSSLAKLLSNFQRLDKLEKWFNEFLTNEELFYCLNHQDSWRLYEAVWYLLGKRPRSEIEDPFKGSQFLLDCWNASECLASASESVDENTKIRIIFEGIRRLFGVYDRAVRAIEGNVLKANAEMIIRGSYSFTRYHVKPKEFLLWAHTNKVLFLPKVERLLKDHVLPKRPGRPKNSNIDVLVDLSNYPQYKNHLIAKEILDLEEAQPFMNKMLKGLKGKEKDEASQKIEKKLREHPDFGGAKRNTGPKSKKGRKS